MSLANLRGGRKAEVPEPLLTVAMATLSGLWIGNAEAQSEVPLAEFDLEQLMTMEVSTASRKVQPLARTPAAAYVITSDEIRRSGANSIPEALRLAPGVEAAQISPSKWSVSIRGFAGRLANKLLVLIDGRSIYSDSFSGVYWEMYDLRLEDIERIEVIRGPGATLWGGNAVNGVINIITRHAAERFDTRAVTRLTERLVQLLTP